MYNLYISHTHNYKYTLCSSNVYKFAHNLIVYTYIYIYPHYTFWGSAQNQIGYELVIPIMDSDLQLYNINLVEMI